MYIYDICSRMRPPIEIHKVILDACLCVSFAANEIHVSPDISDEARSSQRRMSWTEPRDRHIVKCFETLKRHTMQTALDMCVSVCNDEDDARRNLSAFNSIHFLSYNRFSVGLPRCNVYTLYHVVYTPSVCVCFKHWTEAKYVYFMYLCISCDHQVWKINFKSVFYHFDW